MGTAHRVAFLGPRNMRVTFERAATKQTLLLFLADCLPQTAKLSDDTWRILDLTSSSKQQSYTVRFENNCGKTLEAIAFDCDGFQGTAWGVERHGRYCVLSNHDDVQAGATWQPPMFPALCRFVCISSSFTDVSAEA